MEICVLLLAGALLFASYKYEKKIKQKADRYRWLLSEQARFHVIALDFEKQCKTFIEQEFPKHTDVICRNRRGSLSDLSIMILFSNNKKLTDELDDLRDQFLTAYSTKYESRYGTFYYEQYPQYIFDDYYEEITQIYNHYHYIVSLMSNQIAGMQSTVSMDIE